MLTCDCENLHGLLCLVCEKGDSFLLLVFINWGTCLQELGYQGSCLFVWYKCLCTFWYICFQIVFAYKVFFFYFLALVFWLHCSWNIFCLLWCICFQIAIGYRFHIRGLNIHMASIHGDGIGLTFFYYCIQNVLVKNFLMARHGFILSIFVDVCVFCSSN